MRTDRVVAQELLRVVDAGFRAGHPGCDALVGVRSQASTTRVILLVGHSVGADFCLVCSVGGPGHCRSRRACSHGRPCGFQERAHGLPGLNLLVAAAQQLHRPHDRPPFRGVHAAEHHRPDRLTRPACARRPGHDSAVGALRDAARERSSRAPPCVVEGGDQFSVECLDLVDLSGSLAKAGVLVCSFTAVRGAIR